MQNQPKLVVAVSSRSLFHIEDGNNIFEAQGQDAFDAYMRETESKPLRPGVAFPLVQKLLALNALAPNPAAPLVDVVLLSRNSPDAGMRIMNSVQHYGLDIERAVFSAGGDRFRYARAFNAHLFLSANAADVRKAIENGIAAATLFPSETHQAPDDAAIRIAFDGDSVLFSSEADDFYRQNGLDAFRDKEVAMANIPLGDGPFKSLLTSLHEVQAALPPKAGALKIALVTARGMPAHGRVINTLRHWGIRVDEAIFANGAAKGPLLDAFGADIFFDDTPKNVTSALASRVLGAHVPFGHGGIVAAA